MHVNRKPGVYAQKELKTRIHKRRHKLTQWNRSLLKNQNFSIFPPLLTISEVKSRLQESEAAKSGRINQTYTMLVPSASKQLHYEPALRKGAEVSYFRRPQFYIKSVTLPRQPIDHINQPSVASSVDPIFDAIKNYS